MQHSHAIRQASKIRCQLLTFSTLAAALLLETRGLMEDLSMAGARATVRAQMSTMTLGGAHAACASRSMASAFSNRTDRSKTRSKPRHIGRSRSWFDGANG